MATRDTSRICLQSLSQADKHNSHSPRLLHPPPPPHHFSSAHHHTASLSPKVHKHHFTLTPSSPFSAMEEHHNSPVSSSGNNNPTGIINPHQHPHSVTAATTTTALRSTYNDWENRWESSTVITANTSVPSVSLDMDLNLVGKGEGSTSGYGSNNGHSSPYDETDFHNKCHRYSGSISAICICACAFVTPLLMIFLPKLNPLSWKVSECGPECDGPLISLSFKLLLLLISSWLLFARKRAANLPRIDLYRCIILALVMLLLLSYWLFFLVRSSERFIGDYEVPFRELLLSYPVPLVENLLWVHYLAVLLMEIRHQRKQFYIKVVRSPDGSSRSYAIGDLSIQRAAVFVLERYYRDFPVYNPFLDSSHLPFGMANESGRGAGGTVNGRKKGRSSDANGGGLIGNGGPKFYDLDANSTSTPNTNVLGGSNNIFTSSSHRNNNSTIGNSSTHALYSMRVNQLGNERGKSHSVVGTERSSDSHRRSKRPGGSVRGSSSHHHSHNDRFHEEYEFERRVKKRRARLVSSAEEAFTHIKLVADDHQGSAVTMDPLETAQAIFPSMARPLQKYLRVTRQQNRHTLQSILDYLSVAMKYGLSAKAFLEKYISPGPVLIDEQEKKPVQSWGLVSDLLLSRSIRDGAVFMLRQGDISLLVTVSSLPFFDLQEEVIDPKSNRFVLRLNSETSV